MLDPFSVHWYDGVAPPVTVAVKTMLTPVHTVVVPLGVTSTVVGGATQVALGEAASTMSVQPVAETLQL